MLIPTLITDSRILNLIPRSWLIKLINGLMYKSSMATKAFNKVAGEYNVRPFHSMEEIMMGDTVIVTDVAIIHGGQGSVQTSINSGTPIIGIPLHVEQGLNVAMIERHGAGISQIKHRIDPQHIKDKINKILGDNSYKENMVKLSLFQQKVDGVKRAADILCEE